MGLGKSIIALTAVRILKYDRFQVGKVLVIAPKKVAEGTWSQEAGKWDHTRILRVSRVLGGEQKRIKALLAMADVYVINRENVPWLCDYYKNDWPFDMVIVDESTSFKSHSAKRFKALARMAPKISRMVLLTGTPSPNGLEDLWAQIFLLDQGERLEKRYTAFRQRYFDAGWRSPGGIVYNYKAKRGSHETILRKISDICISMKAEDYLQLPSVITDDVPVILDPRARKAYAELERKMVLELPEDEEQIDVASAAALSNKLQQLANGAIYDERHEAHEVHECKLEAFLELVEALHERGKAALVFYSYRHDRDRIRAAVGPHVRLRDLDGPADIDAWNAGNVDLLLAHPASAAYGLNLQDGGHHVIWFGLTWNYEQYVQANARLHRQGQTQKVIVHRLICQDTRDEDVAAALWQKDGAQQYVMDTLKARIRKIRKGEKK